MNNHYSIQSLDNSFCDAIISLILPIQQIEFNVPVTLEGQPDLFDIEGNYQHAGGNFWGAVCDGKIIGTIALMSIGHGAGAIRKMFVQKEFRGKAFGAAQSLFDTLIDFCVRKDIKDLYLGTVDMLKAAHRFYERNGFKRIDVEALPDYFPRMFPDNIFYHLHLV